MQVEHILSVVAFGISGTVVGAGMLAAFVAGLRLVLVAGRA